MKTLRTKALTGLASFLALLGAVVFLAYAANVTCPAGGGLCTAANGATASPTNGLDVIVGSGAGDIIFALAGNDRVLGNGGADTIDGGFGRDTLFGGAATDTIVGGPDNDLIDGGLTGDFIGYPTTVTLATAFCVAGNEPGFDVINGGAGPDRLCGGDGNDRINGGPQGDVIQGGLGNDILNGDAGNDTMGFDFFAVFIPVTAFNALVTAPNNCPDGVNPGNDRMSGGAGNDTLCGGEGNDLLNGDAGSDILVDGNGSDRLFGDVVFVGAAGDFLIAVADGRVDRFFGAFGPDTFHLNAFSGRDVISCGLGADTVNLNGNTQAVHVNGQNLSLIAAGVIPNFTDCEIINP